LRISKMDAYKRMLEVKKLYLKEKSIEEIATALGISKDTVQEDLKRISEIYTKAVQDNKHILTRQIENVLQHLDELKHVKSELWKLQETAVSDKGKLDALMAVLKELEQEARLLKLVDSSKVIIEKYVHVDKVNVLMTQVTEVIKEFVPPDKQKYAYERLKKLGDVLDVEGETIDEEVQ